MSTTDPILDRFNKLPVKVQRDEYRAIIEQGVEEGHIPPRIATGDSPRSMPVSMIPTRSGS